MSISYSKHWNNPRYQAALLRLAGNTSQPTFMTPNTMHMNKNFNAGLAELEGGFAKEDLQTKLKFREGQQGHRRSMHGLDVQSRGLDISAYEAESTKRRRAQSLKRGQKAYDHEESGYWPRIGLGVGSVLMNKYLDNKEKERQAKRNAENQKYKNSILSLLGGK